MTLLADIINQVSLCLWISTINLAGSCPNAFGVKNYVNYLAVYHLLVTSVEFCQHVPWLMRLSEWRAGHTMLQTLRWECCHLVTSLSSDTATSIMPIARRVDHCWYCNVYNTPKFSVYICNTYKMYSATGLERPPVVLKCKDHYTLI